MHSHDRTLLARLGFADPDKQDRRHGWACQYLAQPEQADRLAKSLCLDGPDLRGAKLLRASFEWPVEKGQGQYKTTIGFLDVLIRLTGEAYYQSGSGEPWAWRDVGDHGATWFPVVVVEVKIAPAGADEVIRQLNLYRSYLSQGYEWDRARYAVVTAFPVGPLDVAQLRGAGIRHFRLGEGFARFVAERQVELSRPPDDEQTI